jgi:hypothetical protein
MDKLLNEQQAAEFLTLKPETLTKWRSSHNGPPFLKIAGGVRYDRALLEQWVRDQTHYPEEETHRIMEEARQRIIPSNIYHIGSEQAFATSVPFVERSFPSASRRARFLFDASFDESPNRPGHKLLPQGFRIPRAMGPLTDARMSEIVHHIFGGTCSQYFTNPRRTSSIEVTVGFLEVVGRNGRAPFCNCRARLAATMMKRYVLWCRSSGMVYIVLFFRLSAMCLLTSILREAFQDASSSPILQVNRIGGLALPQGRWLQC